MIANGFMSKITPGNWIVIVTIIGGFVVTNGVNDATQKAKDLSLEYRVEQLENSVTDLSEEVAALSEKETDVEKQLVRVQVLLEEIKSKVD